MLRRSFDGAPVTVTVILRMSSVTTPVAFTPRASSTLQSWNSQLAHVVESLPPSHQFLNGGGAGMPALGAALAALTPALKIKPQTSAPSSVENSLIGRGPLRRPKLGSPAPGEQAVAHTPELLKAVGRQPSDTLSPFLGRRRTRASLRPSAQIRLPSHRAL